MDSFSLPLALLASFGESLAEEALRMGSSLLELAVVVVRHSFLGGLVLPCFRVDFFLVVVEAGSGTSAATRMVSLTLATAAIIPSDSTTMLASRPFSLALKDKVSRSKDGRPTEAPGSRSNSASLVRQVTPASADTLRASLIFMVSLYPRRVP